MLKQQTQTNDDLFQGINISDLEESLIMVDVSPEQQAKLDQEVKEDKPVVETQKPVETTKPKVVEQQKQQELIEVDKGKETTPIVTETKVTKEKDKGGGTPDDQKEDESPSYLHAAALQEEGVLPNLDLTKLKGKEPEEVFKLVNEHINTQISESIKSGIDEYKKGTGEKVQKFFDALDKGVPFNELGESYDLQSRYESISAKDLDNDEDLQKQVYSDLLTLKGFNEAKIKKMVEKSVQDGEILQDAKDSHSEIMDTIETERQEMVKNADAQKKLRDQENDKIKTKINETVTGIKEIIPGLELSDGEKKTIIQNMTIPVRYESRDGRQIPISKAMDLRMKDPVLYEMRLNYLIEKGFFNSDVKKLNDIFKKAETTATKKLIDKMKQEPIKTGSPTVTGKEGQPKEIPDIIFPEGLL